MALYYPLGTTPGRTSSDDIKVAAALEYFPRVAQAYESVIPGVFVRQVDFDGSGDTFVLATPQVSGQSAVLALIVNWSLPLNSPSAFRRAMTYTKKWRVNDDSLSGTVMVGGVPVAEVGPGKRTITAKDAEHARLLREKPLQPSGSEGRQSGACRCACL